MEFLVSLRNHHIIFQMVELIYIPTNSVKCSYFSATLPTSFVSWLSNNGCSAWCKMLSDCGFDLHFSHDKWCWAFFHRFVGCMKVLFQEVSVHVLCPLFNGVVYFFSCKFVWVPWRLWILELCRMNRLKFFLPFCKLPIHCNDSFFCCAEAL